MSKNCQNCELPLRTEQAFCPRCGTSNPAAQSNKKSVAEDTTPVEAPELVAAQTENELPTAAPSAKDFYECGVALLTGSGGSSDHPKAIAAFMNAADLGEVKAMYCAGMMYLNGLGVVASRDTAIGFLDKAAGAQLEIAGELLSELQRGGSGADYPILPIARQKASLHVPVAAGQPSGVTPSKVLFSIIAVVAVLGVAGGGWYYISSSHKKSEEQRQVVEAQKQMAIEEQRQREIEQQEKEQALAEEKRRLEEQEALLKQRAEQLAKQEGEVARNQESVVQAAPVVQVAMPNLLPAPLAAALEQAIHPLNRMSIAIVSNDAAALSSAVAEIRALPPQVRGERRAARALNDQALAALRAGDNELAIRTFTAAMEKDGSDQEIAGNLGYALKQANRFADAHKALLGALTINPERSSSWFNLGLTQIRLGKLDASYASLLLAYKFSENSIKTREWLQKFAQDDSDPATAGVMTRVLSSIK